MNIIPFGSPFLNDKIYKVFINDYKTLTNKYVFNNWINKDTNEIITGNYKVNSDLNLKAEYKKYATIKFIGANGSLERDILAGENAVLEHKDIRTLPNHTFIGWDKTLENIEVNTVFNAKYMANITWSNKRAETRESKPTNETGQGGTRNKTFEFGVFYLLPKQTGTH